MRSLAVAVRSACTEPFGALRASAGSASRDRSSDLPVVRYRGPGAVGRSRACATGLSRSCATRSASWRRCSTSATSCSKGSRGRAVVGRFADDVAQGMAPLTPARLALRGASRLGPRGRRRKPARRSPHSWGPRHLRILRRPGASVVGRSLGAPGAGKLGIRHGARRRRGSWRARPRGGRARRERSAGAWRWCTISASLGASRAQGDGTRSRPIAPRNSAREYGT